MKLAVALGWPIDSVFFGVATTLAGEVLRVDVAAATRYANGTADFVATWDSDGGAVALSVKLALEGFNETALVNETAPAWPPYVGRELPGSPWAVAAAGQRAPLVACPVCLRGSEPGRWLDGAYVPWACRWRAYRADAIEPCLARWAAGGTAAGGLPAPALLAARVRRGARPSAGAPLRIAFLGASTMSMFTYGVAIAFGGEPGTRDEAAKEREKEIRASSSQWGLGDYPNYPGALKVRTYTDGPDLMLIPANNDGLWFTKLAELASWKHLDTVDVVVMNSVLHYIATPDVNHGRTVEEHLAYLKQTHALWMNATAGLASPPILVWRSATAVRPFSGRHEFLNHAFAMLPSFTAAGEAFWRSVGVLVLDQFTMSHWRPESQPFRSGDPIHFWPDTPVQRESANIFINLLCNEAAEP